MNENAGAESWLMIACLTHSNWHFSFISDQIPVFTARPERLRQSTILYSELLDYFFGPKNIFLGQANKNTCQRPDTDFFSQ